MKQLISFSLLILSSCGPSLNYSEEFKPYVQRFERDTGYAVDVPISFQKQQGFVIGVCYTYSSGERKINIDPDYWKETETNPKKDEMRESLIYHELGHCVLGQDHRETLTRHPDYSFLFPNSVMYPVIIGEEDFYSQFRTHYVEELLSPGKVLTH
jgi:hypothetical protein